MKTDELFLASDAAFRSVIDRIDMSDLDEPLPAAFSSTTDSTVRDLLRHHAYDEAWVPGVIEGRSIADGDDIRERDLLGDDPIAAYDALNDTATTAVRTTDPAETFRFRYGDYSADEGFLHLATFRAFNAWSIAKHLGIPFHLSDEIIDGMNEHVVPHVDEWRGFGVFPPPIDPPADADAETKLLCTTGYWVP